jgi:hypothetical protein
MTTDFYKHYGLFVLGARAGEVAYARYLQRYVKPRFVNGILKTNLVLAAGIALPQIVEGTFEGKTFAITLGSLGLSSAAVKAGMSGIRWVTNLARAREAGTLANVGLRASRFARLGGWFYTAAELAVVLYFAEEIEHNVHAYLDRRAARSAMREAGEAFFAAVRDPNATRESIQEATDAYHTAWVDYRNYLYTPLQNDEMIFAERLEGVARRAKLAADERAASLERLNDPRFSALRDNIVARYGSIEAYSEHLTSESEADLLGDVETYTDSYNLNRENHLAEVYEDGRRDASILADVDHGLWSVAGGEVGALGDPLNGRSDLFSNMARSRARGAFLDALGDPSDNRLESYEDEAALLSLASEYLAENGRDNLTAPIDETTGFVRATAVLDHNLFNGDGSIDTTGDEVRGIIDALRSEGSVGGDSQD